MATIIKNTKTGEYLLKHREDIYMFILENGKIGYLQAPHGLLISEGREISIKTTLKEDKPRLYSFLYENSKKIHQKTLEKELALQVN